MQLNPAEISDLIKAKIENLSVDAEVRTRGTVISVTDGIVRIHGLSDVMQGEMLEFPGNTFGLAMNLERDSVGAVVLGEYEHIKEGDTVTCTGRILEVPVGRELIGRVVDSLGRPIDGKGPINATTTAPIEKIAPGVIARQSVDQPMQTGLKAIDSMVPIGRGQRELIIGDRQTGKWRWMRLLTKKTPVWFVSTLLSAKKPHRLPTWCASWKSTAQWITPLWWRLPHQKRRHCNILRLMPAAPWVNFSATAVKMR